MDVNIRKSDVKMAVKTKGIEMDVNRPNGGDCIITKTGLTWCEGKTARKNGKKVSWEDFIAGMNAKPRIQAP